jgi:hypothetical protein
MYISPSPGEIKRGSNYVSLIQDWIERLPRPPSSGLAMTLKVRLFQVGSKAEIS